LGELRLRQGRLDEAEQLFTAAGAHPLARLGQAALSLERGAAPEAAAELERFLALIGTTEPTTRAGALELAVRAHAAAGDLAAAERARDELRRIAAALGTASLGASAAAAEGTLLRRGGDAPGAVSRFEAAVGGYEESGAPFETARARLDLAEALAATGEAAGARREVNRALETFSALGAERDAQRARDALDRLEPPVRSKRPAGGPPLTGRQLEILRLVAQGLSNPEIAARLRLSDHTVKRHVANLLTKLHLSSRAAAAAYAARQGLL
jgi:ATP/maltotriose-dependent transcriptional regulator MalT